MNDTPDPLLSIIAAVAENGVIGANNALPWQLSSDLKRFKAVTWGKPMIMGRKTYASIGKALPGRSTIVLTRDESFAAEGIEVAHTLSEAVEKAEKQARGMNAPEIMVIGGADIFAQWLSRADRLEITEVHDKPEGDTFLPPVDPAKWEETARARHSKADGDTVDFSYVSYRRRG